MKNEVLSGLGFNDEVRFYLTDSKELVQEIHQRNDTLAVASAAVGRSASITGLMGLMLADDQEVTTMIKGDGPLGQIISIANAKGEVRAVVSHPEVEIPLKANNKLDVATAVGQGSLQVVKNLNLKEPFIGNVQLISGEIADDFTYYFSMSEQIPTAISAGVLVDVDYSIKSAGALIVQLLPNASEDTISKLEQAFLGLLPISTLLETKTLEEILQLVFNDDYRILDTHNLIFKCNCYSDKFIDSIKMLPKAEIAEIKMEETVECVCSFCHEKYQIATSNL